MMNVHSDTDWQSGMASLKNHALAVMLAQQTAHIERLRKDLRLAVGEQSIWREIWVHVHDRDDHLVITLPEHDRIKVTFLNCGVTLRFQIGKVVTLSIGEAFVRADQRIQKLLRQQRREKWSRWQWFVWLISFTFAENR